MSRKAGTHLAGYSVDVEILGNGPLTEEMGADGLDFMVVSRMTGLNIDALDAAYASAPLDMRDRSLIATIIRSYIDHCCFDGSDNNTAKVSRLPYCSGDGYSFGGDPGSKYVRINVDAAMDADALTDAIQTLTAIRDAMQADTTANPMLSQTHTRRT